MIPDGTGAFFVDINLKLDENGEPIINEGGYPCLLADKTFNEVLNAVNTGCFVVGRLNVSGVAFCPLQAITNESALFINTVYEDIFNFNIVTLFNDGSITLTSVVVNPTSPG